MDRLVKVRLTIGICRLGKNDQGPGAAGALTLLSQREEADQL
jgi:hypothetical protein